MKVMFCIASLGKGGAERVVSNLSNYLANNNEIFIITTNSIESHYSLNNKIKVMSIIDKKITSNFIIRNIYMIKKLKKIIKNVNPDVIIGMLPEPSIRLIISSLFNKRKIIISERNDPNIEYNNIIKKFIIKLLYKRVNGFVFQTEDAMNYFGDNIVKKSIIIPNPINDEFIVDKPYEGKRIKRIINVGRLEPQKNHKLLIESFAEISNSIPEYELHIYGKGSLKFEIEMLIKKYKLENKIFLNGESDNIKNDIYNSCLFVLSSDFEGMPNALMEAMSLGLPCISTDCPCGGPRYLIKNNINGFLIPVNDKNEMKNKILQVLNDNELCKKVSTEAINISKELNPNKIYEKWVNFIEKFL